MLQELDSTLQSAIQNLYTITDADIAWEYQEKSGFGDIATAVALKLSKQVGKPPQAVAEELITKLTNVQSVQTAEVAGPGFINITFTSEFLVHVLNTVPATLQPKPTRTTEAPVIVEYSQPNIAKPLGVHHLLTTIVGQAISNVYRYSGNNVIAWNYLGDYGTQFGKLAVAIEQFGDMTQVGNYTLDELLDFYVRFHDEVEHKPELEEQAREAFKKLEDGNAQLTKFWQQVLKTTKDALGGLYQQLNVHFDLDHGESFYSDKMAPILEFGKSKHVFKQGKEGAFIVEFSEESGIPPYLVQKGDGATLYSTRDIAQMKYRIEEFEPQKILIVTDVAQKLHFEQLVETCKQLEYKLPYFENVLVGRMRFVDKSMSTRKGNILKLQEVINEAKQKAMEAIVSHGDAVQTKEPIELAQMMGIGALSYGILSQNRTSDIVFDWEKFLAFDGNSAPYIQYTHARARSILRRAEIDGFTPITTYANELTPKERDLLRTLSRWEHVITLTRESHMPHLLCTYLYTLCQTFNSFYSVEPILEAKDTQKVLRLNLCYLTALQLKQGAQLLTISVPDRM